MAGLSEQEQSLLEELFGDAWADKAEELLKKREAASPDSENSESEQEQELKDEMSGVCSEEELKEAGVTDDEIQEYKDKYGDDWAAKLSDEICGAKPADITGDGDTDDGVEISVKPVDVDGDDTADGVEIEAKAEKTESTEEPDREKKERKKDEPKDEGINIGKFAKSILPHFR